MNDQIAMKNILMAKTALEAKVLGDQVDTNDNWHNTKDHVMTTTLRLKFNQNPNLKDFLKNITQKTIAEASPSDRYWGTGISLDKAETTQCNLWLGENNLGKILQTIRNEIINK